MKILRIIIGFIFVLLAICYQFEYTDFIISYISRVKTISYLFIGIGISIMFLDKIVNLIKKVHVSINKMFENIFKNKYLIAYTLIFIAIIRVFYAEIKIDMISIYLFLIAMLNVLFPEIKQVILRISKIRKGDFELELSNLASDISKMEESYEKLPQGEYAISKDLENKIAEAAKNPRGLILVTASEIETRLRGLCIKNKLIEIEKFIPMYKMIDVLYKNNLISEEVLPIIREFLNVRNRIAHEAHYKIGENQLFEFAELGIRILKLIPNTKSNLV